MKTAEDIVKDKQRDIVCVSWDQTVDQTCRLMIANKIGAIVVQRDDQYVGIWSERDLLRNICNQDFDPRTARISAQRVVCKRLSFRSSGQQSSELVVLSWEANRDIARVSSWSSRDIRDVRVGSQRHGRRSHQTFDSQRKSRPNPGDSIHRVPHDE